VKCRIACGEFRNPVVPIIIEDSWNDLGPAGSRGVFLSKPQSKLGKLWCRIRLRRAFSS